jgi:23S rRNA (pseudouridine1915-N3)-methyltransferase
MKLTLFAVGHRLPAWVAAGCAEYTKRMPRELPLSVVEVKPEPRGAKSREQLLHAEKIRLRAALQGFSRVIVLDERGADIATRQLAERLESWMQDGGDTAFVIGGADGLRRGAESADFRL